MYHSYLEYDTNNIMYARSIALVVVCVFHRCSGNLQLSRTSQLVVACRDYGCLKQHAHSRCAQIVDDDTSSCNMQ